MVAMKRKTRNGESGLALIIAIGFLAILSIIGALVMRVSTQDLAVSGTRQPQKQVFYAADRAIEYSMTRGLIMNLPVGGSVDLVADDITGTTTKHATVINTTDSVVDTGMVTDIGPNDMPSSIAELYGDDFGANYYHVSVKAKATKNDSDGNPVAETNVDSSIVRLFKSDDDTIFRTSRGG